MIMNYCMDLFMFNDLTKFDETVGDTRTQLFVSIRLEIEKKSFRFNIQNYPESLGVARL